jgi:hypothetical protein
MNVSLNSRSYASTYMQKASKKQYCDLIMRTGLWLAAGAAIVGSCQYDKYKKNIDIAEMKAGCTQNHLESNVKQLSSGTVGVICESTEQRIARLAAEAAKKQKNPINLLINIFKH